MLRVNQLTGFGAGRRIATNSYNAVANWANASKFMTRTPGSNGSQRKFAVSLWVLRGTTGSSQYFFVGDASGAGELFWCSFTAGNAIDILLNGAGSLRFTTSTTYASTSLWYHIEIGVDTEHATEASRIVMRVNGAAPSLASAQYYVQNTDVRINRASTDILRLGGASGFTHVAAKIAFPQFVDGAQVAPGSFSQPGVGGTVPKLYAGAFGTNGWALDFSNTSDLDKDIAGSNDLTTTGLTSGDASAENVFY